MYSYVVGANTFLLLLCCHIAVALYRCSPYAPPPAPQSNQESRSLVWSLSDSLSRLHLALRVLPLGVVVAETATDCLSLSLPRQGTLSLSFLPTLSPSYLMNHCSHNRTSFNERQPSGIARLVARVNQHLLLPLLHSVPCAHSVSSSRWFLENPSTILFFRLFLSVHLTTPHLHFMLASPIPFPLVVVTRFDHLYCPPSSVFSVSSSLASFIAIYRPFPFSPPLSRLTFLPRCQWSNTLHCTPHSICAE